jgi:hypothetical protein
MDTKSCTGCGETKPLGEFYKDRGRPTPQCKECVLKDRKAKQPQANATRRKRHQQRVDEGDYVTPEFKQCNGKCKRILPIAEFHNCRGTADGKQAKCKQCVSDYQKANRDKTRDNQRAYRKRGGEALKREERSRSRSTNMASPQTSSTTCSPSRAAYVRSMDARMLATPTGILTTITTAARRLRPAADALAPLCARNATRVWVNSAMTPPS